VATSDAVVGRQVFLEGGFTDASLHRILAELAADPGIDFSLDGRTLLDIGANIGTTTVEVLLQFTSASGIAFEPAPENFKLLQENIAANGLEDRAHAHSLAVSDVDGEVTFELSGSNSGDHRVRMTGGEETGDLYDEAERETIDVPAKRFDSLVDEGVVDLDRVGLVWIDAQGHEGHILSGAQSLLASRVPVVLEYWPYGLRRAGGLDRLHQAIGQSYSRVVDVGPPYEDRAPNSHPADGVPALESLYHQSEATYTDLILVS
jgi:FkbM family methyltransferase